MRYALPVAAVGLLISSAALAGPELIEFPEGYRDSFEPYATVNRADERKQVVKIFANDVAIESAKDGAPLDSGSVLVMEIYKARLDADENPVVGSETSTPTRSATAPGNTRFSTPRSTRSTSATIKPALRAISPWTRTITCSRSPR
jgi:hypothetical protein